jgi:glutathione peroxidase
LIAASAIHRDFRRRRAANRPSAAESGDFGKPAPAKWRFPGRVLFFKIGGPFREKSCEEVKMSPVYDFTASSLDGREKPLSDFSGQVLLVVNTASKCGFTPQYEGLEALYRKYQPQGFVVLGFPCNQFGGQEPGDAAEIASFCSRTYAVTFPMFGKIDVNGASAHPLYRYLKEEAKGVLGTGAIKWNFTKFLVDRKGKVAARFAPSVTPDALEKEIEKLL